MTKNDWLSILNATNYLMDEWDSSTSVEIYLPTEAERILFNTDELDKTYYDEGGPTWCMHLYGYVHDDGSVEYQSVLYSDVEAGNNGGYEDVIITDTGLREALDEKVKDYVLGNSSKPNIASSRKLNNNIEYDEVNKKLDKVIELLSKDYKWDSQASALLDEVYKMIIS